MRRTLAALMVFAMVAPARGADLVGTTLEREAMLEDRVGTLLVHHLTGNAHRLAIQLADLEAEDERRAAAALPPTGLVDDVRCLAAGLARTRDARRRALEAVLDADPDDEVRRRVEHRLGADDDAAAADRLVADDRHNRLATLLNGAVRPLGIFSGTAFLAAINPFLLAGSALDSIVTTVVNLWQYDRLTSQEREALARYRRLLRRTTHTTDAAEIARAVRRLGAKRTKALCSETVQLGKDAKDAGDLDSAGFYLRTAATLEGCRETAARPLSRWEDAWVSRAAREDVGRWPADDVLWATSPREAGDYEALLVATLRADPVRLLDLATTFGERHSESPHAPASAYAAAVARHLMGDHEPGRDALADVADGESSVARHAAAVLASPDYDRMAALRAAERRHTRETVRYVLVGPRPSGRGALYGATHLGAGGLRAAESLGIFNVLGVVTRAWQTWRKDPVSNQEIIDHGEALLARQPNGRDAAAAHTRLTDAYARAGLFGRALMHHRATPEPDPDRTAELEESLAETLLERAEERGDDPILLDGIVRHFPSTDAAETARERLAEHVPPADLVLDRELLEAHPALLGPDALDLDPRLLDGADGNGELADAGATLTPGTVRMALVGEGAPIETHSLSAAAYARARAAAHEVLYRERLAADARDGEGGRFERLVPFFLTGTIDTAGGISVAPGVKTRPHRSRERGLYE